jgi:hypothetical protein
MRQSLRGVIALNSVWAATASTSLRVSRRRAREGAGREGRRSLVNASRGYLTERERERKVGYQSRGESVPEKDVE